MNRAVLATLHMPVLAFEDGTGSFSIGQHLADIVSFRREWLSTVSPEHAEQVPDPIDAGAAQRRSSAWRRRPGRSGAIDALGPVAGRNAPGLLLVADGSGGAYHRRAA